MSEIFGHKWVSAYGSQPSETWLAGLIDMTEEELRTGLLGCLEWPGDWPPTLPQFRKLCRPPRLIAFKAPPPQSEEVWARRAEKALNAIDIIKDILNEIERAKSRPNDNNNPAEDDNQGDTSAEQRERQESP